MSNDGTRSEPEFEIEDEIDYLFANIRPNPTREGCPTRDVLVAMFNRELPIGDDRYNHILDCSPCFRELRAMQQERKARARRQRRRLLAAAAAAALVVAGAWFVVGTGDVGRFARIAPFGSNDSEQQVRLDLRPFRVPRGGPPAAVPAPLELPRARIDATILLPVGAEEGKYELRLLDRELAVRAEATGAAAIVNYVTTLRATLDLRSAAAGPYQLAIRRPAGEWQMFPAEIR